MRVVCFRASRLSATSPFALAGKCLEDVSTVDLHGGLTSFNHWYNRSKENARFASMHGERGVRREGGIGGCGR